MPSKKSDGLKLPIENVVHGYTDDELRTEIARRAAEREGKKKKQHQEMVKPIEGLLKDSKREGVYLLIDSLAPKHAEKEDCSDESYSAYGFHDAWIEDGSPKCVRCALLQLINGEVSIPYPLVLRFVFKSENFTADDP